MSRSAGEPRTTGIKVVRCLATVSRRASACVDSSLRVGGATKLRQQGPASDDLSAAYIHITKSQPILCASIVSQPGRPRQRWRKRKGQLAADGRHGRLKLRMCFLSR